MAAELSVQSDQIKPEVEGLKHLGFIHVAAIQSLVTISRLYDLAKERSGPLKSGVRTVEATVKAVVGPVYGKFHGVPLGILKFADRKLGDAVEEVDRHLPSLVKKASSQAFTAAQKAPEVVRSISDSIHQTGIIKTAASLANTADTRAGPVAEKYAAQAWQSLYRLPAFPRVAGVVAPTVAHWAEKYNRAACRYIEKGYGLPVVPTERIAKVFGGNGDEVVQAPA